MCGFTGFMGGAWSGGADGAAATLGQMVEALSHRGPDGSSAWLDTEAEVALGHARLAVLDISPAGAQPMASASGRFIILYNGEIYNHADLRRDLASQGEAPAWRGHCDTETLLAAIEVWGVRQALERSIGMFAFALWDRQTRELVLARDRFGEKPLYYGWRRDAGRGVFLFGSELKALRRHPSFQAETDCGAVESYFRFGYIPAPNTIYCGMAKLEPGCVARISLRQTEPAIERYWSSWSRIGAAAASPSAMAPADAVNALEALLGDAISRQLHADVPVGAFLSGGVDSSTVVALMQARVSRPVNSFSIGFEDSGYDEAPHARAVARHLGTSHTDLYLTGHDAADIVPRLAHIYDEPFGDPSQLPTVMLAQLARRQVTVALTGDGADELFGGYQRYATGARLWARMAKLPGPLRKGVAAAATALSRTGAGGRRLRKGAALLRSRTSAEFYRTLVSQQVGPASLVMAGEWASSAHLGDESLAHLTSAEHSMAVDVATYLPDDILTKVDRAAMASSLETRLPLLDHRVAELAWTLPPSCKARNGISKWPLRQVLARYVPPALTERPKMGFGAPVGAWLRGPLRGWAEELLDGSRVAAGGYLRPEPVRRMWKSHIEGRSNNEYALWSLLMFQAWAEAEKSHAPAPAARFVSRVDAEAWAP